MKKRKGIIVIILLLWVMSFMIPLYVQAEDLQIEKNNALSYQIEEGENLSTIATMKQNLIANATIPTQYDLRKSNPYGFANHGNITINVESQVGGTCSYFAEMMSLQTHLAVHSSNGTYPNLSESHVEYLNECKYKMSKNWPVAEKYFKMNDGPVLNSKCYFTQLSGGTYSNDCITVNGVAYANDTDAKKESTAKLLDKMEPDYYVHDIISFTGIKCERQSNGTAKYTNTSTNKEMSLSEVTQVRNQIKQHIINNGGAYCSIRTNDNFIGDNLGVTTDGRYSQYDDGSISGSETGGHAITIIGWNDNYDKNKFTAKNSKGQIVRPTSNGAWLIVNNYGPTTFENGCQWISYEDYLVGTDIHGIVSADTNKKMITYKFDSQSAYSKVKELLSKEGYIEADDSTKTIKVLDLIINELQNGETSLDLRNSNLSSNDLKEIANIYPNLSTLNISSNNFSNSDLKELVSIFPNLSTLDISNNNISDISALSSLKNLQTLKAGNNKIDKAPSFVQSIETIDLSGQKLEMEVSKTTTEVKYPDIIKRAKDKNDRLYCNHQGTFLDFEFKGCKENADGTGIILTADTATVEIGYEGFGGPATGTTLTVTKVEGPTVKIASNPTGDKTNASSITYTFTWSENVTGFTADDITVTNGVKGTFIELYKGRAYSLVVTNTGSCTQTVSVAADKCTNNDGVGNAASATFTKTIDRIGPVQNHINVTSPATGTYKTGQEIEIEVSFNEVVYGNASKQVVNVNTAPVLKIKFGTGAERVATYSSTYYGLIRYKYKIVAGDVGKLTTTSYTGKVYDELGNETTVSNKTLGGNVITANVETYKKGDVDGNGEINLTDLLKLKRYIANEKRTTKKESWKLSAEEIKRGDTDGNGQITLNDVLLLKRYIAASKSAGIKQKHPNWMW